MFSSTRLIESLWITEKRWVEKGRQRSSKEESLKELTMAIEEHEDRTLLHFKGGPTGHESYNLYDLTLGYSGEFCICAGTPNRWPACFVDMKTVKDFVESYKLAKQVL